MAHQADIGEDVFDRWATFYIFEHQGQKYACVWKVLTRTMMTEEEVVAESDQRVKDEYAFDEKKTLKFIDRARKDYDRKVKEYAQRCEQRAINGIEKQDEVRHSKMDEVVLRSTLYDGKLNAGDTFMGSVTIVNKTSNSFCLRLYRVTKYGRTGLQWFTQEEFGKRFKYITDEQAREDHVTEKWHGVETRQEDGEVL